MIRYVQNKSINSSLFEKILKDSTRTNQFTNKGPAKFALEKKLEELLEISDDKSVLCVTNGTLALHGIYHFLNKTRGKLKFVSPSFTFPSCVLGGQEFEILDIENKNYTIPLTEENIEKYDVFIITNLFGTYPGNINEWIATCKERGKVLIFDNASSPMSKVDGVNICNLGDFAFGSLHHTKYMGFGEGGFVVVPKHLYEEFELILGFGFSGLTTKRKYSIHSSNYKMSDVAAASILQHLEGYDFEKHIQNQQVLIDKISKIKGIEVFNYADGVVYGNLPIVFSREVSNLFYTSSGIEAQKYYYPLVEQENSMFLYDRIINLPLNCNLSEYDIKTITSVVRKSVSE